MASFERFELNTSLHWTEHFVAYGFCVIRRALPQAFCDEGIEIFKQLIGANLSRIYLFARIAAEKLVDHSRLDIEREGSERLRRKLTSLCACVIFKSTACKFRRILLTASPCGYWCKSPCQALILV